MGERRSACRGNQQVSAAKAKSLRSFLSTREAAARLGVSLSTIQQWVEDGVLPAWKTAGGHRRIPAAAIEAIRERQLTVLAPSAGQLIVLVVEDNPLECELYRRHFSQWNLPLNLMLAKDGFEGLMLIGQQVPDLIISDLAMPGMDGFMFIRRLRSSQIAANSKIIAVSALSASEIAANGGLPDRTVHFTKPVPFAVLRILVEDLIDARRPQ